MHVKPTLRNAAFMLLLAAGLSQIQVQPAQFTPIDFGQSVKGFQDDFSSAERDPNWVATGGGGDLYEQVDGVLRVTVTDGDPNHLVYEAPDYSNEAQEVLARIRATTFGTGDFPRGGVAVAVDNDSSEGINLHFRDSNQDNVAGRQFKLLDDKRAWGPAGLPIRFEDNAWFWLRLRQTGSSSAAGPNIFAKVWPADGSTPEPDDWQMSWARDGRVGFAGLAGNSGGSLGEFEVDYVLIKAEGLPTINVAASAFPTPFYLSVAQQPQDATVGLNQTASFTSQISSSSPATLQWQRAAAGSSTFSDIAGASSSTLTTAALTAADEGAQYRLVASLSGTTATSRVATVHVDSTIPSLVSARTLGSPNKVTVRFSEPVTAPTTGVAFAIDNGVTISSVTPGSEPGTFELATSALNAGTTYSLTVNGIHDPFGNEIPANTKMNLDLSIELPLEFGQTVAGYQDDFDAATRNPLWLPVPSDKDAYEQIDGLLKVTVVGDNPGQDTHLLYSAPDYSDSAQEVLARIRMINFGKGDAARAGVAVAVNTDSSEGINLHFRDQDQDGIAGRQMKLLDDRRAWGPGYDLNWENNTWYWLRLRQTGPDAPNNIQAKVWKADGATPEPGEWQLNWGRDGRVGLAGLVGSSIGGISDYDVDYILIKAEGLPTTTVAASAFGFGPFLNITQQPSDAVVPAGQNASLLVGASGSSAPTFQWQKANPGSSEFANIPGATSATLTISSPSEADNGSRYRAVVSVGSLSKTSGEATIITDVTAPTIVSARTLGNPRQVTVLFSEDLAPLAAGATFSIDNGVTVTGTAPGASPNVVELTTSEITLGKTYTLTVNGVSDLFKNVISPLSTAPVDLFVEVPVEFGQSVNGFQDDFTAETRDPNWVPNGPGGDVYEQAGGVLKVGPTSGDPNHLLYEAPGYSDSAQEVLARMKVKTFATGDYPRGGVGVGAAEDTGQGIELHFRDSDFGQAGTRFRLLDDARAWGPALQTPWTDDAWFWLRLKQTASTTDDGDNIMAKVWPADGTVAEPTDWQATWGRADRTGFAGIAATSTPGGADGTEEFEVDYILIKAEGLPATTVAASAFSLRGPAPVSLRFSGVTKTATGQLSLEWTGTATLEQADTVKGPWTPVTPAASPLLINVAPGARFYRLHNP
jgi:hypothetical protein